MSEKLEYEVPGHSPWHAAQNVAQGPEVLADNADELRGSKRYRITIKEIVEQPQWWWWNGDYWDQSLSKHVWTNGWQAAIYGTTATRDAKRDALLAAAKVAGEVN